MFGRSRIGLAEAAEILGALLDVPPDSLETFALVGMTKDGQIHFGAGDNLPPEAASLLLGTVAGALIVDASKRREIGEQN